MRSPRSRTVVSPGGGVQSSVRALIVSEGAFDRTPDCASSSRPCVPTRSTQLSAWIS